jgi:hypothetical protein
MLRDRGIRDTRYVVELLLHVLPRDVPCSGQGKKDTKLSYQSTFLIFIGAHVPERRVLPLTVIEHLDVRDDIGLRFLTRGVRTMRRPFTLSAPPKPLGTGIVKTVPLSPHTPDAPMVRQQGALRLTGILTPAVRMVQETC